MKHFQAQYHPAAETHTLATLIACPDYTDLARANDSERAQDTLRSAALRCAPLRSAALRCAPLNSVAASTPILDTPYSVPPAHPGSTEFFCAWDAIPSSPYA